jgi:hypothetical protein
VYRLFDLDVWELTSSRENWPAQLENLCTVSFQHTKNNCFWLD